MIDTIHFRIEDLKKHRPLVVHLTNNLKQGSDFYEKGFAKENLKNPDYVIAALKYHQTGNVVQMKHRNKLKIKSSHYEIAFSIDYENDYIDFNFSIPKFLHGTNVKQLVPHQGSKYFSLNDAHNFDKIASHAYPMLMDTLNFFIKRYLFSKVDTQDMYIIRIDLCFNLVFRSEGEARRYLEILKKVKRKFARKATSSHYENSIFFKGQDSSFKVYHKGDEFKINDKKKLKKINEQNRKETYDIEAIQDFSNRILRYETTFRKASFTSAWYKILLNPSSPYFDVSFSIVDRLAKKKRNARSKAIRQGKEFPQEENKELNRLERVINKRHNIKLFPSPDMPLMDKKGNFQGEFSFLPEIFDQLLIKFKDDCKQFYIEKAIGDINTKGYRGGFATFLRLINAGNTPDQIKQMNIFARSSFFQYKARFKKVYGFSHVDSAVSVVPFTFYQYYLALRKFKI